MLDRSTGAGTRGLSYRDQRFSSTAGISRDAIDRSGADGCMPCYAAVISTAGNREPPSDTGEVRTVTTNVERVIVCQQT